MNILDTIKPIRLLKGCHENTGETGSGCMMNVISYLQGDDKITDKPGGVDKMIREVCIQINDFLDDHERHQLHEFIFRAMNSVTQIERVRNRRERTIYRAANDIFNLVARWHEGRMYSEEHYHRSRDGMPRATFFGEALAYAKVKAYDLRPLMKYDRKASMLHVTYDCDAVIGMPVQYYYREDVHTRHAELVKVCLELLDDLLPDEQEPEPVVTERAIVLVETARIKNTAVTV